MQEFVLDLQKSLTNKLSAAEVMRHVNYYREYIEVEVRKGRSEQEVLEELGDPRLIAKSIIQASASGNGGSGQNPKRRVGTLAVLIILFILVLIVIGSLFISVFRLFLPILLPASLILVLVRWLNRNRQ